MSTKTGLSESKALLAKDEDSDFNEVFLSLIRDVTETPDLRDMDDTNRWLARVLQYNVPHGKKNRGLTTALAYRYMAQKHELNQGNIRLSYILGWTVEMLQAFFCIADDIMDDSETRRGRPCWYKLSDVGNGALNDTFLIEGTIYLILKKHFRNKDYYVDLLEIMHDVTHKTTYGQSLDTRTGKDRKMESYTMEKYKAIVKYKTSHYTFYLPVVLAMAMAGISEVDLIRQVKTVTLEMGQFFQIQDDYLDCFGDASITGKIGTDIQDCKCSWLFVTALERATAKQRIILVENYGQPEDFRVNKVKEIYVQMKMSQVYDQYEQQTFQTISTHIQQMSPALPKKLFEEMLGKIYKRTS